MLRRLTAVAAAGLITGALAVTGTAYADHNKPALQAVETGECGTATFGTDWSQDSHLVDTARLVVQVGGEQKLAPIGETITVGPFDQATVTIKWRVWGGGERDYDAPALVDLQDLLDHIAGGGDPLDLDAPGVGWFETTVTGCVPEPTTPPAEAPTAGEPGEGGGDEEPGLPMTGTPLPLMVGVAVLLMVAGAAAIVVGRRRRIAPRI